MERFSYKGGRGICVSRLLKEELAAVVSIISRHGIKNSGLAMQDQRASVIKVGMKYAYLGI